jgi:O-antigen ligase
MSEVTQKSNTGKEDVLFRSFLYLFAFLLPFEGTVGRIGLGYFGGIKILGTLIVVALILKVLADAESVRALVKNIMTTISMSFFLFIVWSLLSVFWAPNSDWTLVKISTYLGLFIVMQSVGLLSRKAVKRMWELLLVGAALSLPFDFILPLSNEMLAASGRFTSGGQDPNDYANLIVVILSVVFCGILPFRNEVRNRLWRFVLLSSIFVAIAAVLLSLSRTALINLLAFVLAAVWLRRSVKSSVVLATFVALAIVFVILFPDFGELMAQRYSTLQRLLVEEKVWAGRIDIWRAAVTVFTERPLTGVGAGNFAFVSPYYSYYAALIAATREDGGGGVAHNTFLSVLAETGMIGFLLFGSLLLSAYVLAWRLLKRGENLGYGLLVGLITYTIAGLTLTWEYVKIPYLIYGSLLALEVGSGKRVDMCSS